MGKHGDIPRGLAKHLLASQLLISSTDGDKINRNPQPIRIRPILIILFTIIYSILYTRKERGKKRQTLDRAISSGTAAARNRKNRRRQCKGRRDETVARRVLPTLSPPTSRCQRSSQPAARGRNSQNRTAHVIHKRNHSFFFIIRTNINLISSIIMIYVKWINFNFNFTVSVYTRIGTDIRRQRVVVVSSTSHSQTSRLLLCPRYEQSIAVSLFFFYVNVPWWLGTGRRFSTYHSILIVMGAVFTSCTRAAYWKVGLPFVGHDKYRFSTAAPPRYNPVTRLRLALHQPSYTLPLPIRFHPILDGLASTPILVIRWILARPARLSWKKIETSSLNSTFTIFLFISLFLFSFFSYGRRFKVKTSLRSSIT